jgi:hypothetical protein
LGLLGLGREPAVPVAWGVGLGWGWGWGWGWGGVWVG